MASKKAKEDEPEPEDPEDPGTGEGDEGDDDEAVVAAPAAASPRARARDVQPRAPASRASADLERPRVQLDVSELQGNAPEDRFERILDRLKVKDDVRSFAKEYWRDTPAIQNPYALFDFLSKLPGLGGASVANMIVHYVYGGPAGPSGYPSQQFPQLAPGPYGSFAANPYAVQASPGRADADEEHPRSMEEETQDLVRGMIASANAAMRVRMMMQAIGPMFGSGSQAVEMVPRPRVDESGQPLLDTRGAPVVDWVPVSPRAAEVSGMMQRFERGESIDPTKLAALMVDMFKTGVQTAVPAGGGGDTSALMQMQAQVHQANIETLRTQFAMTEKLFDTERQQFLRQIEQMSPEKQAEQLQKLKAAGLLGTDNLETLKLNLKVHMWEVERGEARDRSQAEASARAAEAQRGRDEFHDLVTLGKDALEKALAPVTTAIGDGLRVKIAGGGSAPPVAPPSAPPPAAAPLNYGAMSADQRARARAKLVQVRAELQQHEQELDAAESESPPPAAAPPAEEPPYGA